MRKIIDEQEYQAFTREEPFDFSKKSTVGCGGRVDLAFSPSSVEELTVLVAKLDADGVSYRVLGNLSNVLPPDGRYNGVVIRLKNLDGLRFEKERVFAYAGVRAGTLLGAMREKNGKGAEFLYGIPCTLGGALFMNAGADGKYICEIVESVLLLRKGKQISLPVGECGYAYKRSVFMEGGDIILGGYLRMEEGTKEEIDEAVAYYRNRRAHLPQGRSMGCVFKNPHGDFAGRLIEGSGLKGFRIGGAKISEEHANFIINDRGGTSADIRALITVAKNAVRVQYGITLEEEIRYL